MEGGDDGVDAVGADVGVVEEDGFCEGELEGRGSADAEEDFVDQLGGIGGREEGFLDVRGVFHVAGVDGEVGVDG